MERKLKKNGEAKKSGGKRKNCGRNLRYNEKTKTVAFRVLTVNLIELKALIKDNLNQYAEEAKPSIPTTKKKYIYVRVKKERVAGQVKKVGKWTIISYRVPVSKVSALKKIMKNKLKEITSAVNFNLTGGEPAS